VEQLEIFSKTTFFDTNQELKVCGSCQRSLPLSAFPNSYHRKDGTKNVFNKCKTCKSKETSLIEKIKNTTPSPPPEYECPICQRTQEELLGSLSKNERHVGHVKWNLDHNHETLEFRGWLCGKCNSALGWFNDDITLLHRAIDYLQNNSKGFK